MKLPPQQWSGKNQDGGFVVMLLPLVGVLVGVLVIAMGLTSFMTSRQTEQAEQAEQARKDADADRKNADAERERARNENTKTKMEIVQVSERASFTKTVMLVGFPMTFILAYSLGMAKGFHIRKELLQG